MIHHLLTLTRPLFVLDCETTGLEPKVDRIIEIGFQQWTAEGMVKEWRSLVNPGIPIPPSVHGITSQMLTLCQRCQQPLESHPITEVCAEPRIVPTFRQLASSFAVGFVYCDFAGQNVRFDLRMLAAEFARTGISWSYAGARIIDSGQLERLAVPRSLEHLHEKYAGVKHDNSHGALADVRAAATVIVKQLETHLSLPRDLDALHEAQWPGWLTTEGHFRLVDGVPTCMFGKHRNTPIGKIPRDYWDWLLAQDFPEDVRRFAMDAKWGRYR